MFHSFANRATGITNSICEESWLPCESVAKLLIRICRDVFFVISAAWWMISWILYILTFPLRLFVLFVLHFPIFSVCVFLFCFSLLYLFRRLTAINLIHQFTHNVIPYVTAVLYSILTFIFPQINTMKRVLYFFLHPIRFILDLLARVDQRAARVRNMVEVLRPSGSDLIIPPKYMCVMCKNKERSLLFLPCQHLCICCECKDQALDSRIRYCPICRVPVKESVNVRLL